MDINQWKLATFFVATWGGLQCIHQTMHGCQASQMCWGKGGQNVWDAMAVFAINSVETLTLEFAFFVHGYGAPYSKVFDICQGWSVQLEPAQCLWFRKGMCLLLFPSIMYVIVVVMADTIYYMLGTFAWSMQIMLFGVHHWQGMILSFLSRPRGLCWLGCHWVLVVVCSKPGVALLGANKY